MPNTSVKITGLAELNALFGQMAPAFNNIFSNVTSKHSKTIFNQQNQKVPVKTGRLKRSIGTAIGQKRLDMFVDAPYARFINYGTKRMPGRPFFTEPIDRLIPTMLKEIDMEFGKWIKTRVKR
jgi:HK97 gp10 family phage protein